MPRKPNEDTPRADVKMPEETRKAIYGKSEKESETGPTDATRPSEYSGPSQTGHKESGPKQGS